ncbi:MAG TPA: hypothetical protein VJC03_02495, partial [bacterium]|nr:hypothetical protein [bacterium]
LDSGKMLSIAEGTEIHLEKNIGGKMFWGYNIRFMESILSQDKLQLRHELELLYRLKGSQFLKSRMELERKGEKYLGIEQQFRF